MSLRLRRPLAAGCAAVATGPAAPAAAMGAAPPSIPLPADAQSLLAAAGPQAARIEWLWWVYVAVVVAVYVAVTIALCSALWRGRRPEAGQADPRLDARLGRGVAAAVAATVAVLIGLLAATLPIDRQLARAERDQAITVEITAQQWWWRIEYDDPTPSLRVTTANELVIPAGEPVRLRLLAQDVIHSFWVPRLHGKADMIPGQQNAITIQADAPGVYRGQCAEFCGLQHARMALLVEALPRADFEAWLTAQRAAAAAPADAAARRGREVFRSAGCPLCHAIRGTGAFASLGPDLTHLASRRTLAAGSLPNARGPLAGWIADPQHGKPGARMPAVPLPAADLEPLLAYLGSLR